jgi:hypothetical protein
MSTTKTGMSAGRPSSRTGTTAKTVQDLIGGDSEETSRVNFDLPKTKHRALKAYAANNDKTIRQIFEEYVDTLI